MGVKHPATYMRISEACLGHVTPRSRETGLAPNSDIFGNQLVRITGEPFNYGVFGRCKCWHQNLVAEVSKMTSFNQKSFDAISQFDKLPDSMLLDLNEASIIAKRGRASFYRDFKAGRLSAIKVGSSTRIRVGELRRFIGMAA